MASFFGFQFKRKKEDDKSNNISFTPPLEDDGAIVVTAGGAYGTYVDLEGSARTEAELVTKYREMSLTQELDLAIDEIVNEAIIAEPEEESVSLDLEETNLSTSIKKIFAEEFKNILQILEFNYHSYDIFRRWYVDGRLYYHVIIDPANPSMGIKELRYIDPRKIRKVREIKRRPLANTNVTTQQTDSEYFIYNDKGFNNNISATSSTVGSTGVRISNDSIIHTTSGLMDKNNQLVLSYLHKAIKPLNQLRTLEDATLIYRISRAPSRRIFYIDVGNLPKMKAEQYLRDIMARFKNRVVYDSSTGEIRDDRKFMTMLEDFWLPRREGGKGTEIQQLEGGQSLGQLDDVKYFQQNLYKSLNVPISRLQPENSYSIGRATEITREEIKFAKFIDRLQLRFSSLFLSALEKQLILKKIITPSEWNQISNNIRFKYARDNLFSELKTVEIMRERMSILRDVDDYVGKYYSMEWVYKNVLRLSEDDINDMRKQIEAEAPLMQNMIAPDGQDGDQQPQQSAGNKQPVSL